MPNVLPGSNEIFKAPLVGDPGTLYEYGINTDWLGRVVEAVSRPVARRLLRASTSPARWG